MIQNLAIYLLLTIASAYMIYRIYGSIKKKKACDKCELMQAVNKEGK